jgi:predicted ester cyclase
MGSHQGEFMGHAGTGRRIDFAGVEIIRCANGKIVERWGEWDALSLEAQLKRPD